MVVSSAQIIAVIFNRAQDSILGCYINVCPTRSWGHTRNILSFNILSALTLIGSWKLRYVSWALFLPHSQSCPGIDGQMCGYTVWILSYLLHHSTLRPHKSFKILWFYISWIIAIYGLRLSTKLLGINYLHPSVLYLISECWFRWTEPMRT